MFYVDAKIREMKIFLGERVDYANESVLDQNDSVSDAILKDCIFGIRTV